MNQNYNIKLPQHIANIDEILSSYDALFIDMCGVLHDGTQAFPGINETLQHLVSGTQVILFSNSPRLIEDSRKQLAKYGVEPGEAFICTSGQYFIDSMNERATRGRAKVIILGANKNPNLVDALLVRACDIFENITEAQYILILDNADAAGGIHRHDDIFAAAVTEGIIALCPNPDIKAVSGRDITYPQGAFAERYKEMGGAVEYFGKPVVNFYQHASRLLAPGASRILAIGDNMDTDICGAHNYGIDSLLVLETGVCRSLDPKEIYKGYGFLPTYTIDRLR